MKMAISRIAVVATIFFCSTVSWAAESILRIGVMADMSGLYADLSGPGSAYSVELAVKDFGGLVSGRKIEIVQADHQNKPDLASAIARRWYSTEGVDVIVNAAGSAVALAVVEIAKTYNKSALITGAVTNRLSNESCTPNHVHYGLDNDAIVNGTVNALVGKGLNTWYFLVADYAFGTSLLTAATNFIEHSGGKVIGSVKHPLNSQEFSSQLLQAQASKAQVIGLANASTDMTNSIAQANEFGIAKGGQTVAAMIVFITDVHALGLQKAQDTLLTTAWYWDSDDKSRAFAKRFFEKFNRVPTYYQAADYSATTQFLKAVSKTGWADGRKAIAAMKGIAIDDFFAKGGKIREDGLLIHDVYLARVKKPSESRRPWDYYDIIATVPGDKAFQKISESRCPLVVKK